MSEQKKILNQGPFSGIAVPIAIVLVGALLIFGVTKMLSSGKDHRDLVQELNSKTFGNRWVAAYELSKYLANSKIPQEDIPWVVENLGQVYKESVDARTRNFVVLALGTLKHESILPIFNAALADPDPQVKFNTVVAIGNLPKGSLIEWQKVLALLEQTEDTGLRQVALLAMATHQVPEYVDRAIGFLNSSDVMLRYYAAMSLIYSKKTEAISVISELFSLPYPQTAQDKLNAAQIESLKVSTLEIIEKVKWLELTKLVENLSENDPNIKVSTKAKQTSKVLKN